MSVLSIRDSPFVIERCEGGRVSEALEGHINTTIFPLIFTVSVLRKTPVLPYYPHAHAKVIFPMKLNYELQVSIQHHPQRSTNSSVVQYSRYDISSSQRKTSNYILTALHFRHAHAATGFAPVPAPALRREQLGQGTGVLRNLIAAAFDLRRSARWGIFKTGATALPSKTRAAAQHSDAFGAPVSSGDATAAVALVWLWILCNAHVFDDCLLLRSRMVVFLLLFAGFWFSAARLRVMCCVFRYCVGVVVLRRVVKSFSCRTLRRETAYPHIHSPIQPCIQPHSHSWELHCAGIAFL